MAAEVGTGLVVKYGLIGKIAAMFAASALGAAIIAWYHPATRTETLWRAIGAGIGGVFVGGIVLRFASNYISFLAPPTNLNQFWDWMLEVVLPLLFMFGGLFWGLVGMWQDLSKKIRDSGADAVADRVGLNSSHEIKPQGDTAPASHNAAN